MCQCNQVINGARGYLGVFKCNKNFIDFMQLIRTVLLPPAIQVHYNPFYSCL